MDRKIMSVHDNADADDVNCELTLKLPHNSPPSSTDNGGSPSSDVLPSPCTSFVLPSPCTSFPVPPLRPVPSLPASSRTLTSRSHPKHVSNHSRRSLKSRGNRSLKSRGRGGAALRSTHSYSVGGPRNRRNPAQSPRKGNIIPPPFPWATNSRASVHSLEYLSVLGFPEVEGESQCKHCEARIKIKHDLIAKFREVVFFMVKRMSQMHERAPPEWLNPTYPGCEACGRSNCMRPVLAAKKRHINWLYLFLGQWLGFCTLEQLKYFCKHAKKHRTGAKDRVLYLSYMSLFKQLDPTLPFVQ